MLLGVVMSFGCLKWQYANEQRERHNERG